VKIYNLEDIKGGRIVLDNEWLTSGGNSFVDHETADIWVLVSNPETGSFTHPDHGRVDMYNTHATGELRWREPWGGDSHISATCYVAVKALGLRMFGKTDEEWAAILSEHEIGWGDLSGEEQEVLADESGKFTKEERVNGERAFYQSSSVLYDLQRKGLIQLEGSTSGPYGDRSENKWRSREFYKATKKGREVLAQKGS